MVGGIFGQNLPPQSEIRKMATSEKMMLYNMNKKSPARAVTYSFLLASSGHAYADNWSRGLLFFGSEIGALTLAYVFHRKAYDNGYCERGTLQDDGYGCDTGGIFTNHDVWYPDKEYNIISLSFLASVPIIYFWEKVDAVKEVKKYNKILYKSIYGKEPPSISLNLQPTYQGATLTMSYALD